MSKRDYMRGYMRYVRTNAKRGERIWEAALAVTPTLIQNALKETGGTWEESVAEDALKIGIAIVESWEKKLGKLKE